MSVFAFQRNANKRTRMGRLRGLASSSYFLLDHQYSSFWASSPITNTYFEGVNSIKFVVNTDLREPDQETYLFPLSSKVYIRCMIPVSCLRNSRDGRVRRDAVVVEIEMRCQTGQ